MLWWLIYCALALFALFVWGWCKAGGDADDERAKLLIKLNKERGKRR